MTRRAAMANQKGGVGKTTFVCQTAAAAAALGARVLVGDMDPQCNATTTLDATPGPYTMAEVLNPDPKTKEVVPGSAAAAIVPAGELWPRLDVIPSSLDLAGREMDQHEGRERRLTVSCEGLWDNYDLVLWDLPPSLGQLTVNGLTASDEVWVITDPTRYGLDGTGQIMSTIDRVRRYYTPDLVLAGIVVNEFDKRTTEAKNRLGELRDTYGEMIRDVCDHTEVITKAGGAAAPLEAYGAEGRKASDWFKAFAERMLQAAA
jgi:chromosome partitioning protein